MEVLELGYQKPDKTERVPFKALVKNFDVDGTPYYVKSSGS